MLGVPVTVAGVDLSDRGIVTICQRDHTSQAIPVLELPMPGPDARARARARRSRVDRGLPPLGPVRAFSERASFDGWQARRS